MVDFGWSYPPGCNSVPGDEDDQMIDITEQLQGMGKKGHGLCGRDADLDYGGQIKVTAAFILEEAVEAHLNVYATICEPAQDDDESDEDYEARREGYGDLVCYWDHPMGVTGEWSGDDWCFDLKNDENFYRVKIPFKWNDRVGEKANINRAVNAIYKAIWKDAQIKAFQESMTELAKAGERPKGGE